MGKEPEFVENSEIGIQKTTKDGKVLFEGVSSWTIGVVKMVNDPDMKVESGTVVKVTHGWNQDCSLTIFLKAQLDMLIFSHVLTNRHLRSLMELLIARRIDPCELSRMALANFKMPLPDLTDCQCTAIDKDMEKCGSGVACLIQRPMQEGQPGEGQARIGHAYQK